MTSTAISAQGSMLQVSSSTGTAVNVTGLALGYPTIVTGVAHGFKNGDVTTFAGLGGNTTLNGNQYVVRDVTTNTFAVDANTTGGAAYTSGGTATPAAWTTIGNFKTIKGFDGKTAKLDATNLASTAKEYRAGLQDPGSFTFDVDVDNNDAGQLALQQYKANATIANFKLTLPNGHTATFQGFVEQFPWDGGVDKLVSASVSIIITGPITYA
ncbi:phage tail tube protein [Burkholderia pseudomallei]|uniref:phage tail tube protein n=1 Tax=Burkholderia pseudomallei TaxID=28450 RepID=UPI0018C76BAB|nr:phage tail tube protein [Burkholderia pseudomallei]MBG1252200.1 phage tail protein [Burkholderia pseudomallei]